jgi:GTP cyclohydrolase I
MSSRTDLHISRAAAHLEAALAELCPTVDFATSDLRETPDRMARALAQLTAGTTADPAVHLETTFDVKHDQVILVRDVPFNSLCEHHVLPFSGHVSVAYIPRKRIVGLSKIPRMVRGFAQRLQVQERFTTQVAEAMEAKLKPVGVAVYVRAHHSCMSLRGVQSHGEMVTSVMLGAFRNDTAARAEVLNLMGVGR